MLPSTPTPPHFDEPRWEFTKRMELSQDDHLRLKAFAEERGLVFFSSPFSVEAVELLEEVGVPVYKIASGELTNPPLLEAIAATGKPVLLSSGMSGMEDVERAARILRAHGSRAPGHAVHLELPLPARARQPAGDDGHGRAPRRPVRALRPHARHLHLDRGRRARRGRRREALHAVEAAVWARPPRVAHAGGAGAARRRHPPGRGGDGRRPEGARPRARPGAGDLREERSSRRSRSPRAPCSSRRC